MGGACSGLEPIITSALDPRGSPGGLCFPRVYVSQCCRLVVMVCLRSCRIKTQQTGDACSVWSCLVGVFGHTLFGQEPYR